MLATILLGLGILAPAVTTDELRMGDPFVARFGDAYVLTGTTRVGRGFEAWVSDDLATWRPVGMIFEPGDGHWGDGAYWAPELFEHGGRYYLAYSARLRERTGDGPHFRLGFAASDSPTGPFEDVAGPWCDLGVAAIDAHVLVDGDQAFLYFARVGVPDEATGKMSASIHALPLSDDLVEPAGEAVEVVRPEQAWERVEAGRSICNEGPYVFRDGDTLRMLFSAGHWAEPYYAIGQATAADPLGEWHKPPAAAGVNPLIGSDLAVGLSGPGHCSVTTAPDGQRVIVYHAHADPADPRAGRVVKIAPLKVENDLLAVE